MDSFSAQDLTEPELQLLGQIQKRKEDLIQEIEQIRAELAEVQSEIETLELMDNERANSKAKALLMGKKKFNVNPKKGLEFLMEQGLLDDSAQHVAEFLYKCEGLSKKAIGECLGQREDFNQHVLEHFVALHDFRNMDLVQALRQLLWSFRLPGEAQKIDRMMQAFAGRYCVLNPGIFKSADSCYVVSFSVIMLNTSLHNPSVKDKPTVEKFIDMNRDVEDGSELPTELLTHFYESIRSEPFKIPEDDGRELIMHSFFNPDKEGWLWKQGGRYKTWKRRWFVLSDGCLYYLINPMEKEPRGIIPLDGVQVRHVADRSRANCFEIYSTSSTFIKACKTDSEGKVIEGRHSCYKMASSTVQERDTWISALEASIGCCNSFHEDTSSTKRQHADSSF